MLERLLIPETGLSMGYDSVSADVIWMIVTRYLPILKKEVQELLNIPKTILSPTYAISSPSALANIALERWLARDLLILQLP